MSIDEDRKIKILENLNISLQLFKLQRYSTIDEVDVQEIQKYRSASSSFINLSCTEHKHRLLYGYCGSLLVRAAYSILHFKQQQEKQLEECIKDKTKKVPIYSSFDVPLLIIGSIFYSKAIQYTIKYGGKILDKILNKYMNEDSMNKQIISAIILSWITYKISNWQQGRTYLSFYDSICCFIGHFKQSDSFQWDLRKLQWNLDKVKKLK